MQNGYLVTEDIVNVCGNCRGQPDLRDQQDCGTPRIQNGLHRREIDGSLA